MIQKPSRLSDEQVEKILIHQFPDVPIRSLVKLEIGNDFDFFEINGEWLFRFPRIPEVARDLEHEITVLNTLNETELPIEIPNYCYLGQPDRNNELIFVGHRKIAGRSLTEVAPRSSEMLDLAPSLGAFLARLHKSNTKKLKEAGIKEANISRDGCAVKINQITKLLSEIKKFLSGNCINYYEKFLDGNLYLLSSQKTKRRLVHGDFNPSNILVETDPLRLSGVVDWSGSCIGDPAWDFAFLWIISVDLFHAVTRCYSLGIDQEFNERVIFYGHCIPLVTAGWALESHNKRYQKMGLAVAENIYRRMNATGAL